MGVMNPGLVMRNIIPVVMAGVLGIYGLIVAVILQGSITQASDGFDAVVPEGGGVRWSCRKIRWKRGRERAAAAGLLQIPSCRCGSKRTRRRHSDPTKCEEAALPGRTTNRPRPRRNLNSDCFAAHAFLPPHAVSAMARVCAGVGRGNVRVSSVSRDDDDDDNDARARGDEHTTQPQDNTTKFSSFSGFAFLSAGLCCGLSGLAAGMAIGVVGDAGVRAVGQQEKLFVGMILILIFAEVRGRTRTCASQCLSLLSLSLACSLFCASHTHLFSLSPFLLLARALSSGGRVSERASDAARPPTQRGASAAPPRRAADV